MKFGLLAMAAGLAMTITLAINLTPPMGISRQVIHTLLALLTLICLLSFGWPIFQKVLQRKITLESLFLIGLLGAYAASLYSTITTIGHIYYEVVLVLLAIYRFGQLISQRQTAQLEDLSSAIPGLRGKARINLDGQLFEIAIPRVAKDDRVVVQPGETVPVDGDIQEGRAYLEELAHTGEPFPVAKSKGDSVLAGSKVLDGRIELIAATDGKHRELDRLYSHIGTSQVSPTENLAQKVLNIFVPSVVAISILTFLFWWLIIGDFDQAIFNALAVTIVACPCGLGLAIPLAARRGLFRIRLLGIEPKRSYFLEDLASTSCVIFDKTGTLSSPLLKIRELVKSAGAPPALESWLAAAQLQSTHPVARPFWEIAEPADLSELRIETLPARGIAATFRVGDTEHTLTIGNHLLRSEWTGEEVRGCSQNQGERQLAIFLDGELVAEASLEESTRDSSIDTIRGLQLLGLRVEIMTGDVNVPPHLRDEADRIRTSLTAKEKGELIEPMRDEGLRLLYVGDGLNDVEALRSANVSIGLSSGGSIAPNVADATLDHDDLSVLPEAIRIARTIRVELQQLLGFALLYNFFGIALATAGILHPVVAALLMLGSSITVLSRVGSKIPRDQPEAEIRFRSARVSA